MRQLMNCLLQLCSSLNIFGVLGWGSNKASIAIKSPQLLLVAKKICRILQTTVTHANLCFDIKMIVIHIWGSPDHIVCDVCSAGTAIQ